MSRFVRFWVRSFEFGGLGFRDLGVKGLGIYGFRI